MQNLTKENFFNDLQVKYPHAMHYFQDWIDQYKKENNWQELFGWDLKFHHLPFDMQRGILTRYAEELNLITCGVKKVKETWEAEQPVLNNYMRQIFFWQEKHMRQERTESILTQVLSQQDLS